MKGAGALSDAEGKKLTDAIGALDPQMPQDEFKASLSQIISDLKAAEKRMPGYAAGERGKGEGGEDEKNANKGRRSGEPNNGWSMEKIN
jgi:hypothetical protein